MQTPFYLLSLTVSGIKNIEKPLEIRFYKESIINNFNPKNYRIKSIYGENDSGKTAIVTAVKILQDILLNQNYLSDRLTQQNLVENINKKTRSGFIQIEYYFRDKVMPWIEQYHIDFEVREDNRFYISGECLRTKNGRYSQNKFDTIYETKNGSLVYYATQEMLPILKDKTRNLLDQRSFTSFVRVIQEEMNKIAYDSLIHVLFLKVLMVLINVYIDEADDHRRYIYSKLISELPGRKLEETEELITEVAEQKISYSDDRESVPKDQIENYKAFVSGMCSFIKIFKPDLLDILVETKEREDAYRCNLIMQYPDYSIDAEFESRGIRKMMDLYAVLNQASKGGIAFIDELDASINDVYLGKLLEYFAYYGKGQLIFTAHNLSPMKILKSKKNAISFISSTNTIRTWACDGNRNPENAYRDGFIEDSPFNIDATDFLGILGGVDE